MFKHAGGFVSNLSTDCVLDLSKSGISQIKREQNEKFESKNNCVAFLYDRVPPVHDSYGWRIVPLEDPTVLDLSSQPIHSTPNDSINTCDTTSLCSSGMSSNEGNTTPVSRSSITEQQPSQSSQGGQYHGKDVAYYERRRKNNLAAKRSRDAKRKREADIKSRVIILEEENKRLRQQLATCCCGNVRKSMYNDILFVM